MQLVISAGGGAFAALLTIGILDGLIRQKERTIQDHPLKAVLVVFPFAILAFDPWLPMALLGDSIRIIGALLFFAIVVAVVAAWKEEKRTLLTHIVWTVLCGVAGFGIGWLAYRAYL